MITVAGTSLFNSDIAGKVITLDSTECDYRCCEYYTFGFCECSDR